MKTGLRLLGDEEKWEAMVRRDRAADGAFVYAVRTTGVYCRPSCGARLPKREHVRFHRAAKDAEKAGFRPCRRCRPKEPSLAERYGQAVAKACRSIEGADEVPGLEALAKSVGLSPSHFHRVFKSLTGVTPKEYAAAHRSRRVRRALTKNRTVTAAVYEAGFKSNGCFYATSAKVLGMKPKTFRAGGKGMVVQYAVGKCWLGSILVAATDVGICAIALGDDAKGLVRDLKDQFPEAELIGADKEFKKWVAKTIGFVERPREGLELPLDIQGSAFQQRVWQILCKIRCGQTTTYAQIARRVGRPTAVRAIARAIATNKIAVAIPCHRVIRSDGSRAGYRWGVERKSRLLEREKD
jgi:AraC family transcriptional regulator, regulatory protein of adaptative response / methylated-DNA-[protein]-cysteine methyltransferase